MSDKTTTFAPARAEVGALAIIQVRLVEKAGDYWKVRIAGIGLAAANSVVWVRESELQVLNEIPLWQRLK